MSAWAELFPAEDFAFKLTLKRGDLAAFCAPSPDSQRVLAERRHWLETSPERHVVHTGEAEPVWAELVQLLGDAGVVASGSHPRELGRQLEPDLLVLRRDEENRFRLRSGVVVFPSWWTPEDKLGATVAELHGVVPGLNPAIGAAIDRFLDRLRPGMPATRVNWGLAATAELNLHPALGRPRLTGDIAPNGVWLRLEHQILAALPASRAVVFGIRIQCVPLPEVLAQPAARAGLHRALATMPEAVAAYKGLTAALPALLRCAAG